MCTAPLQPKEATAFASIAGEVKRIFWRKRDADVHLAKLEKYLSDPTSHTDSDVARILGHYQNIAQPKEFTIHVSKIDGSSFTVPVQSEHVDSVEVHGTDCAVHMSPTTIGDLKKHLEELCGYRCQSQILYAGRGAASGLDDDGHETDTEPSEFEFSDEQTVGECWPASTKATMTTTKVNEVYLVIDAARHYWHDHAALVRSYKVPVITVIRAMPRLMRERGFSHGRGRRRLLEFLQNCRKAVACLLEHPTSHPPRTLRELAAVERFMEDVVMPIFRAVHVDAAADSEPVQ